MCTDLKQRYYIHDLLFFELIPKKTFFQKTNETNAN